MLYIFACEHAILCRSVRENVSGVLVLVHRDSCACYTNRKRLCIYALPPHCTAFAAQAQAEGRFALDLEFIREHSYVPRLALIQMAVSDTCAIIDPLEVHDLSPLLELCKSPHTLKVLHAAGQDTEILHWHAGIVSEHIFDTQLAAALVGLGDQLVLCTSR